VKKTLDEYEIVSKDSKLQGNLGKGAYG